MTRTPHYIIYVYGYIRNNVPFQLKDIIKDPDFVISEGSMERVVNNVWVATLAADIGQTSLLRPPQRYEAFGPKGSWNSSYCTREYKLDVTENDHSYLTNAEFYGGLDGTATVINYYRVVNG